MIPTSLVYIGDTLAVGSRHKAIADLMAATAAGTALAIVFGGLAAHLEAWRLAFAAPALAGATLGLLLGRLPEPEGFDAERREGPLIRIRRVLGRLWAVMVVGIALVEGAVILGFLTFLAPSLESVGFSPAVAGLAVGLFGVALFGGTRTAKLVADRLGPSAPIFIGGGMLALGCASAAVEQSLASVGAATVLAGVGFAFMHPPLLSWATEVVPEARHRDLAHRRRPVRRKQVSYGGRSPAGGGRFLRPALRAGSRGGRPFGTIRGPVAAPLFRA